MMNAEECAVAISGKPDIEKVRQIESFVATLPQVDLQTKNEIHGGMCCRTVFIPAGTVVTGALTNIDNICIVHGDITATTDTGPVRLTGFNVLTASCGYKRAVYAHADTYWTTVHRTDLTDIEDIEKEMTAEYENLQTAKLRIGVNRPVELEA